MASGGYSWRQFLVLFAGGLLAVLAVIPYQLALQPALVARASLPLIVLSGALNGAIEVALAVGLGLLAARAVELRAPVSEALALRGDVRSAVRSLDALRAALLGAGASVLVVALDVLLFHSVAASFATSGITTPNRLLGFLASFEGGVTEEILLRLFVMSASPGSSRGSGASGRPRCSGSPTSPPQCCSG